jgi:hypothetical protein
MVEGRPAWEPAQLAADSVLAVAGPDDRIALAAVADGLEGWWEGSPESLRQRLRGLRPTAKASDWPEILTALESREEDGTETYLFTDGAKGRVPPGLPERRRVTTSGVRRIRTWTEGGGGNRALQGAVWVTADEVALVAREWGWEGPAAAEVGRVRGLETVDEEPVVLDGGVSPVTWSVSDTATFGFRDGDRLESDDRWFVATGGTGGAYRVSRWVPLDEPSPAGGLFWEAALESARGAVRVNRFESLVELSEEPPHLALLSLRAYREDQVELLASLVDTGTRLLFVPSCPEAACIPRSGWFPSAPLALPDLNWRLSREPLQTRLASRPTRREEESTGARSIPRHLLDRVQIRPAVRIRSGGEPEWRWDLSDGSPALWVRGPVAVWLVPFGPPVTRLGTTPLFPLVASHVMSMWDRRWRASGNVRVGEPIAVGSEGGTISGPLGRRSRTRTWEISPGGIPPRPTEPGIYRVATRSGRRVQREPGSVTFVAVNGDPSEGDLEPIESDVWRATWGVQPAVGDGWEDEVFHRRRGPEIWRWLLMMAVAGLVAEVSMRRGGRND